MKITYTNCNILTENGWIYNSNFTVENGVFFTIDKKSKSDAIVNLKNKFVLPGIVDIHGDFFEKCISPRTGVFFPYEDAIYQNDNYLLASGITTFFYSISDSFEKGLRSRETAKILIELVRNSDLKCNSYIHLRHEEANYKNIDELLDLMENEKIDMISINSHVPKKNKKNQVDRFKRSIQRRFTMNDKEINKYINTLQEAQQKGEKQTEIIHKKAKSLNIPIASHDVDSLKKAKKLTQKKYEIAEFPVNLEVAKYFKSKNVKTIFGAPNLMRGGSHVGALSVTEAIKNNALDILCSDYHYNSLFYSPFKLEELKLVNFEQAWKMISLYPANAVGLKQKGSIKTSKDADFVILDNLSGKINSINSIFINGIKQISFS